MKGWHTIVRRNELPAFCPVCDGSLYIEITPESTDDDYVECAHCRAEIRIGDALGRYNRLIEENRRLKEIKEGKRSTDMSLLNILDPDTDSIELKLTGGKDAVSKNAFSSNIRMFFNTGLPGIIWFDYNTKKEYEVLEYTWSGPRYQDVMIQNNDSSTQTRGGRKGRLAGAIIGTILMPGLGTVIGAAVGTGKKEDSNTRGQTISHVETREVPVNAYMKLRDLERDQLVNISFECTSEMDVRIRNNITLNLEQGAYIEFDQPELLPEPESEPETKDVISQLKELKALLDDGAISKEEYEVLKKKII